MSRFRILAIFLFFMCNNTLVSFPLDEGRSQTPEWVWKYLSGLLKERDPSKITFVLKWIKSDLPDGL